MIRKVVRAVTFFFAALAIPAAMLVAPLPASADSSIFDTPIVESFGPYCIGSDTTNMFAAVVERTCPGRMWNIVSLGSNQFELELHSDNSKCIAAANNGFDVVLHPCQGGGGVVWIEQKSSSGHVLWLNRLTNLYLSGHGHLGSQLFLDTRPGMSGDIQQFDPVP